MILEAMHVIAVCDLAASAAFYRDVLGFEVRESGDDGWRIFAKGACTIMAGECKDEKPARDIGDHSYFAYLVVDDVDAIHARIAATRTEVVKPLADEPWKMRELGLRTIDGHRIMFGQRIG